ncbi:MAG: flagellar hook-basal body protein [Gaiellales bacterium]
MLNGLFAAAAGMNAQQTRIDSIANDISNVDTTGYKSQRLGFRDLIYNVEQGMPVGAGSAVVDGGRLFTAGSLQNTGDPLSVALSGPGFFQVRLPDGTLGLTRSGDFRLDASGTLVDASGNRVEPNIRIPANTPSDQISIAPNGTVTAGKTVVGRLTAVTVQSPAYLRAVGNTVFTPTAQSGQPRVIGATQFEQGYLESSNVDLADSMTNMIDAQRSFQMDSRVIQTQDQLMQIANQIRQ